jgi:hypothetical protein
MKREHLLRAVEAAVGRAMAVLAKAHPDALQGHRAQSLEKRLIGMLSVEMLRVMGHQSDSKLRLPGERYKPSCTAREMQRRADLEEQQRIDRNRDGELMC